MKPVINVSAAVPSSEALATIPIFCGLKPVAERWTGRMMMAKPSPKPRSARAPYRHRMSCGVFIQEKVLPRNMPHLRKRSETTLGCVAADRAVADGPDINAPITPLLSKQRPQCPDGAVSKHSDDGLALEASF